MIIHTKSKGKIVESKNVLPQSPTKTNTAFSEGVSIHTQPEKFTCLCVYEKVCVK